MFVASPTVNNDSIYHVKNSRMFRSRLSYAPKDLKAQLNTSIFFIMAAPRLPFLYPHLFKPIHVLESSLPSRSWSAVRKQSEALRGPKRRHQSTFPQRYGPAAEPMPPSQQNKQDIMAKKSTSKASKQDEEKARVKPTQEATSEKDASRNLDADTEPERLKSKPEAPVGSKPVIRDADEAHPQEKVEGPQLDAPSKPLEKVLHMPPPTSSKAKTDDHKLPHLQAPPYVHHFDTYTLVKDLGKGGYTQDQSITIMKAVRSLLATNLDLAKDGLVSKSDVENVRPISAPLPLTPANPLPPSNRNPTSSAPPAPNSAPRSKTRAPPPPTRCGLSAHIYNTRSTF